MTEHTTLPWEYERGFRDAAHAPGDHYTIADDFLTIYMGEDAIENFDPEKHGWIEVHGQNQEANAHLVTVAPDLLEELAKALYTISVLNDRSTPAWHKQYKSTKKYWRNHALLKVHEQKYEGGD